MFGVHISKITFQILDNGFHFSVQFLSMFVDRSCYFLGVFIQINFLNYNVRCNLEICRTNGFFVFLFISLNESFFLFSKFWFVLLKCWIVYLCRNLIYHLPASNERITKKNISRFLSKMVNLNYLFSNLLSNAIGFKWTIQAFRSIQKKYCSFFIEAN